MQTKTRLIAKVLSFLLLVGCFAMGTVYAEAAEMSGSCGEQVSWSIAEDTLTISGTGAMEDYAEGNTPWFRYRGDIKTVKIEEGVTRIGTYAFYACTGIESVQLPSTLLEVGGSAFAACTSVTDVYLPSSVTKIEEKAFYNCSAKKITLSEGLLTIGKQAFAGYTGDMLIIPKSVYKVGEYALPKTVAFCGARPEMGAIDSNSFYLYPHGDASWNSLRVEKIGWHPQNGNPLSGIEVSADITEPTADGGAYTCNAITVTCQTCKEKVSIKNGCKVTVENLAEADCTTEGERKLFCSSALDNDFLKVEVAVKVPAKGHTVQMEIGKEPTCTEDGMTEGKTCSVCSEVLTKQEVIPAKGHTEGVVAGKAATCTEAGLTEGKACTECDFEIEKQEIIPPKGHLEKIAPAKTATCTEKGLTEGKVCADCGMVFAKQREIPALGHTYSQWTVNKEATANTPGEQTRVCGTCGAIERKEIPALSGKSGSGTVWLVIGIVAGAGILTGGGVFCWLKWDLVSGWLRKLGIKIKEKTPKNP